MTSSTCLIPSPSEDLIDRGFSVHINEIELVMHPDHLGGIIVRQVWTTGPVRDGRTAIVLAERLLRDPAWHLRLSEALQDAQRFVLDRRWTANPKANGRACEFNFLQLALSRMGAN